MEQLKTPSDIFTADKFSASFVLVNTKTGEGRPKELNDYYREIAAICLDESVPEDVRSYFETIKNVYLYGWFVSAFYTIAMFLSFTVIEMALRNKFKQDDPERDWSFPRLIQEAKKQGLIASEGFPSVKARRDYEASFEREGGPSLGQPVPDYCSILEKSVPYLRNSFAHPEIDQKAGPGDAYASLIIASEFINQLFNGRPT